ncbi:MAG: hypothetical protein KGJ10_00465 [Acidobacteriota bacterium]|nr:hypothetical protein [Acidobacteriota bacterium]MDE3043285.1 hypothetical protein [Acidobacteriota bacterium]MDE3108044.1 hypothetical protein [Acidobacteriota bacterium]
MNRQSLHVRARATLATMALMLGLAVMPSVASATTLAPRTASTAPCNVTIASGSGEVVPTSTSPIIVGVTAGATTIKIDCNASSQASIAVEASLLATAGTSGVLNVSEVDIPGVTTFTASATDTGCPSATAGQCTVTTFAVPATFSATDPNATCAPSTAQINDGVFGCAIAVATAQQAPITGAEYLMTYASQSAPAAPTIAALQTSGSAGSLVNVSDAAGASSHWWGNSLAFVQAALAGVSGGVAPGTCGAGGGYGSTPTSYLKANWFAANSTTPISEAATSVSISNVCYDGKTLYGPVLSGTLAVPATATPGSYTVYLCEINTTPNSSNDAQSATNCGALPSGESWIDASFNFTVAPNLVTQNLPVAGTVTAAKSATFSAQLVTSGATGATDAVTFTQSAGAPNLVVSSTGAVTTKGALSAGTYTASGTTSDASGATGTFSYSLTVSASPVVTAAPKTTSVTGFAVPGKTVVVTVHGTHLTARPKVTAPSGVRASITKSTSNTISVKITLSASAKKGSAVLVFHFAGGKTSSVKVAIR